MNTSIKKQFLSVTFKWSGASKVDELSPVFDKAIDWLRYAPNCWILWTSSSPQKWLERIKPHLGDGDHVFIVSVNIKERAGWLPKSTWEWLDKPR